MKITIATSQFPVSSSVSRNKELILSQIKKAAESSSNLIHFPEGALSGYAGVDLETFSAFNWGELKAAAQEIMQLAKRLGIWVILGAAHPLTMGHKPHNSLYIIGPDGLLVDRYDKMFCSGDTDESTGDLKHYSPGNHFCIFKVNGITCGTLICYDYRFPELYREYKKAGVELMFHSFHAGAMGEARKAEMEGQVGSELFPINPGRTIPEITMPATMIPYAANNYMWISSSNTSAPESCWASLVIRPDGVTTGVLQKNVPGILISQIDTGKEYYDSTRLWRQRAMDGIYHSGKASDGPRILNRTEL